MSGGPQARFSRMEKPVQWMTLRELRDELDRTRAAWEAGVADLEGVLGDGQLPALSEDARRHQMSRASCWDDRVKADRSCSNAKDFANSRVP